MWNVHVVEALLSRVPIVPRCNIDVLYTAVAVSYQRESHLGAQVGETTWIYTQDAKIWR